MVRSILLLKGDEMAKAKLTNKRAEPNVNGLYVVDVICSKCDHTFTVSFSGWSAVGCEGCGTMLKRTPYRKATR
jgi:ribosomal protein S27E